MGSFIEGILADLQRPVQIDPAARGYLDVILSYPGFHAVTAHRLIHPLYRAGIPIVPRFLSQIVRFMTGIEIHPGATLGTGVFIDHGMGVVIGETAEVGNNVTLNQGVTLGGTSLERVKRHPTIEDDVIVGADALVLGAIRVGRGSKIGAGSVVVKDVPPNSTVVGIPGRVVLQDGRPVPVRRLPQVEMPDPHAPLIERLNERIAALEQRLAEIERLSPPSDDAAAAL
jgi:serine O-acetyltransferase